MSLPLPMIATIAAASAAIGLLWWLTGRRMSGLRAALAEARQRLHTDSLTGLYNRDGLLAALAARADAGWPGRTAALVFIDLDAFKQVNDWLGHGAGDDLLIETARRIDETTRLYHGCAARLGGDEFAAWLPVSADLDRAADMFLYMIIRPVTLTVDDQPVTLIPTVSIGIALADTGESWQQAARRADIAMYHAKQSGGACRIIYHTDMAMPDHTQRPGARLRDLHRPDRPGQAG